MTRDEMGYADLRSYAAIGDGRTVALVADDGRIDWLPLPNLVSTVPFAAILDAVNGGWVGLQPTEPFTTTRRYLPETNVLETTFTTDRGSARVTDSLNTGVAGRLPWTELARRVDGLEGEVPMRFTARPGTCLNAVSPWVQETVHGLVLRVDGLTVAVVGSETCAVTSDPTSVTLDLTATPGSRHLVGLVGTEREPVTIPAAESLDAGVDRTVANWEQWSSVFDWDGRWQEEVRRSALLLKLLIHSPAGSMAAAATTSLPESLAGGKNWDYRFAWVRDMAYSLDSLYRFGLVEETHGAISWLLSTIREHGPEPHILYQLDGTPTTGEVEESDVPGWRGIGPVVSGNRASGQLQLGVYGDLFSIVALFVDQGNLLDADTGRTLAQIADLTCDAWRSKDAGMWELPEQRHYVTSKMGCWLALVKAVHLAELGQIPGDPSRWRSEAERIREWVEENGWSEELGTYVWYPGTDELDASILLHAISGFDRGPRMSRTLDVLADRLGTGGRAPHLYRFSGAGEEEGAFVACSFWMVSALALVGRADEAAARMEALLATPNDVGVMSEMVDPVTGEALGNLPQALSHLALINAAITYQDETSQADSQEGQESQEGQQGQEG